MTNRIPRLLAVLLGGILALPLPALAAENSSPPKVVGWRGNFTGLFPDADPPTHWGRIARGVVAGMTCQSAKPAEGSPGSGQAVRDGLIRQWLVIGPFPVTDSVNDFDQEQIAGEARLMPAEGDKVGQLAWQRLDEVTLKAGELGRGLARLQPLVGRVDALESGLTDTQAALAQAQRDLAQSQKELAALRVEVRDQLAAVDKRVGQAEERIIGLDASLTELQTAFKVVEERVTKFDAFFVALRDLLVELEGALPAASTPAAPSTPTPVATPTPAG